MAYHKLFYYLNITIIIFFCSNSFISFLNLKDLSQEQSTISTSDILKSEEKRQEMLMPYILKAKQKHLKEKNAIKKQRTNPIQNNTENTPKANNQRTDGLNFLIYHYDIQWFSGDGRVPANNYIYRWDELPNHYLIEKDGAAGESIWNIQIGTTIIIDGKNYTCYKILHHIDPYAGYNHVLIEKANISAQTCENNDELGPLTIWFFN